MMHLSLQRSRSWTARIVAGLGLCVALAAMADDAATPASNAQSNAARATPTSASTATASAPKVICFQNSIRCFTARGSKSAALDLRAPAITRVFSEAELQQKLDEPQDETREPATVQVQGERQAPNVSAGLLAIPWAIVHPTQAWRIFMPVPEAK